MGFFHHLEGLGIGTIAAAFTMGKAIGFAGDVLDKHFRFGTYKTLKKESCCSIPSKRAVSPRPEMDGGIFFCGV